MRRPDGVWVSAMVVFSFLAIGALVFSSSEPKKIPPVTTEEKILGELTLTRKELTRIRQMMEEDRKPVQLFIRNVEEGKIPNLPGVKR